MRKKIENFSVWVGSNHEERDGILYPIENIDIHPRYQSKNLTSFADIGVILVSHYVTFLYIKHDRVETPITKEQPTVDFEDKLLPNFSLFFPIYIVFMFQILNEDLLSDFGKRTKLIEGLG